MFESLRKLMYIGLGAAVMSRDKVKQAIDEMVSRGEVSAEEGRKLYDEMISRAEEETRNLNDRIRGQVRQYLTEAGIADRNQIEVLARRVDALEYRIDQLMAGMDTQESGVIGVERSSEEIGTGIEPEEQIT